MKRNPGVFLSYSRKDSERATALEQALGKRGLPVWRDARSIAAGERWSEAIEKAIRGARGVVVLLTAASADSDWVTYEYAFATGAGVPVVAVVLRGVKVPSPVQQFQIVQYSGAQNAARRVDEGIRAQSRDIGQERASAPKLVAKFQEANGRLCPLSGGRRPAFWIDLWVEHAPRNTRSVSFEILDLGFKDPKWTVRRERRGLDTLRDFLTDDMNSYGDVEIWARGAGPGTGNWSTISMLYEALVRYYRGRQTNAEIRRALKQIRKN